LLSSSSRLVRVTNRHQVWRLVPEGLQSLRVGQAVRMSRIPETEQVGEMSHLSQKHLIVDRVMRWPPTLPQKTLLFVLKS
jgi:hypothetical protein